MLFQPVRWFDCLDVERSKVKYYDVPPYRISWVDDLVLKNVSGVDEDIFRVEHLSTRLFCTERCVSVVKQHKLKGFHFQRVLVSTE